MSIRTHSCPDTVKEKKRLVGPWTCWHKSRPLCEDSLSVAASVCRQLAWLVLACRLIQQKAAFCDTLVKSILQGYSCGRGTSRGNQAWRAHFTEVPHKKRKRKERCRAGDKKRPGCRCLYIVRAGWRIVCRLKNIKRTTQPRSEHQVGGF